MAKTFLIFSCILAYVCLSSFAEGLGFFGFGSPKLMEREEDASENIRGSPYNKQCKTKPKLGKMTSLEVIPCEGTGRCNLVKGTNVTLKIEFVTFEINQRLFGKLHGLVPFLFGASVPFGEAENLCMSPQIDCPVQPNKVYHYERNIYVDNNYPSMKLDVSISVEGDDNGLVACALIPVQIIKASKSEDDKRQTETSYSWF